MARKTMASHIEKRVLDGKANAGMIRYMKKENDELREQIKLLRERLTEYAVKDTPKS